jgi:hypothetical protein
VRVDVDRHAGRTAALIALLAVALLGCRKKAEAHSDAPPAGSHAAVAVHGARPALPEIAGFCSRCHSLVAPGDLPADRWDWVIRWMYEIARKRGLDSGAPAVDAVIAHYEQSAARALEYPSTRWPPGPLVFDGTGLAWPPGPGAAGAATLALVGSVAGQQARWWVGNMIYGAVIEFDPARKRSRRIAKLAHPAHLALADLDGDRVDDVLVADLGELARRGGESGAVAWLHPDGNDGYASSRLLSGVGRVADVAAGDADGDGDQDVAVAVFDGAGARALLLLNEGASAREPRFKEITLDARAGAVDVEFTELDGQKPGEIVVLFSQEDEMLVSYGVRAGGFEPKTLARSAIPGFGSSSFTVADIDGDGDRDIVWVHGDVLDTLTVRPYHGLELLVNRGRLEFEQSHLAFLPGATRALVTDLDRDGDQDVVATACLPWGGSQAKRLAAPSERPSLIWLEQKGRLRFEPHAIDANRPCHADIELMDFDLDGDEDIVVPEIDPRSMDGLRDTPENERPWATIYRNEGTARVRR